MPSSLPHRTDALIERVACDTNKGDISGGHKTIKITTELSSDECGQMPMEMKRVIQP
jgi:hypothetical protein